MNKEKIKDHFRQHKAKYAFVGGAILSAGFTYLITREMRAVLHGGADSLETDSTVSLFSKNFLSKNSGNNIVASIHTGERGSPGFITRCIETNEIFATQGDAARTYGIPDSILSDHLNRGRELVEDLHFERLGLLG